MSCAHVREELGGYVLGALEPAEREAVAAHLARCPECAAEHARLAALPALLAHAEGLEIPRRARRRSRSACSTRSRTSAAPAAGRAAGRGAAASARAAALAVAGALAGRRSAPA